MLILGLSTFGQNPAACLLRDGQLVAFAEEERFIRLKSADGFFPAQAVNYCLHEAGISIEDVDKIAVGWDANKYRFQMPLFFARTWWKHGRRAQGASYGTIWNELISQQPGYIKHYIKLGIRSAGNSGQIPPIEFVSHHLAHAASTFYASGFDDAAILIVDASGEERSTSLYMGNGSDIDEIEHVELPDSFGWFYAAITAYLGFRPYQQDGYVMGLAPYGKPNDEVTEKINKLLKLSADGKYQVDPTYTLLGDHDFNEHFSNRLVELLGPPRFRPDPITDHHKSVAYAAQARLEEAALALARRITNNGQIRNLCMAGGVALNCVMNGELARSGLVDKLFVQPASHDAGSALGAAMVIALESGDDPRFAMQHTRYGPGYTPDQVKAVLDEAGLKYTEPESIADTAAEAIVDGKVVAWFDGRMEAGPRALGGRSILGDASRPDMDDYINARVKHRDMWRPFCPSIINEASGNYLDGHTGDTRETGFMIVAYPVPEERRDEIPSVVHVDGSTRPQTVNPDVDANYYRLINAVGQKTGTPIVLNTSLNVKGEPICCTPSDALRCFASTGIDALAIQGFWVEKP